jgi:hypothetical protein
VDLVDLWNLGTIAAFYFMVLSNHGGNVKKTSKFIFAAD